MTRSEKLYLRRDDSIAQSHAYGANNTDHSKMEQPIDRLRALAAPDSAGEVSLPLTGNHEQGLARYRNYPKMRCSLGSQQRIREDQDDYGRFCSYNEANATQRAKSPGGIRFPTGSSETTGLNRHSSGRNVVDMEGAQCTN